MSLFSKQSWLCLVNSLIIFGVCIYIWTYTISLYIYILWPFEGLCRDCFCCWFLEYFKTQEIKHCVYYRQSYPWIYSHFLCRKDPLQKGFLDSLPLSFNSPWIVKNVQSIMVEFDFSVLLVKKLRLVLTEPMACWCNPYLIVFR